MLNLLLAVFMSCRNPHRDLRWYHGDTYIFFNFLPVHLFYSTAIDDTKHIVHDSCYYLRDFPGRSLQLCRVRGDNGLFRIERRISIVCNNKCKFNS